MNATAPTLAKIAGFARAHGAKAGLEVTVNFVLPFLIYNLAADRLGAVQALLAASAPPIVWSIVAFIRERKLDAISILVLSGIALSLIGFAGGGGVKFLQLRENLVTGMVGLLFLGSAAIGRPLIFLLARAGVRRRAADQVAAFEALRDDGLFRRAMAAATLAWGFGLVAACALNCALVFILSIKLFLLISPPISYVTMALLTAWTFWYVPRSMRQAMDRRSAEAQGANR